MPLPIPLVDFGLQVYIFALKIIFFDPTNWLFGFTSLSYKGLDCQYLNDQINLFDYFVKKKLFIIFKNFKEATIKMSDIDLYLETLSQINSKPIIKYTIPSKSSKKRKGAFGVC